MISMLNQWKKQKKPLDFPSTLPSGKKWPRISIITPSFNQGGYIEDTILSILLQSYPNTEHIIVDGGSTDETLGVVNKYKNSLAQIISEPDNGQSDAINKGMALATGDILTWLNSDDMLAPGSLAAIAMAFDVNDVDLVAGVCQLFLGNRLFASHLTSCPNGPLRVEQLLDMEHYWQAGMYFYQPEVMFSREIWEKAGGYVDEKLHFCMDSEMFLRFSKYEARLQVIGHPVAWFRYHEDQKTNDPNVSPDEFKRVCQNFAKDENIDLSLNNDKGSPLIGRPLNIAMVNDVGFQYGAGIAHKRLSDSLILAGHTVSHYTLGFNANKDRSRCIDQINRISRDIDILQPDLVICGNLHGFSAEANFLEEALGRWPLALCIHDLWILTGKCPHPFDCKEYVNGCSEQCTHGDAAYPAMAKKRIKETWKAKRKALNQSNALLLCNSDWTLSMIKESLPAAKNLNFKKLAMGVDSVFFEHHIKFRAREYFDLPQEKFIILLAGVNISDPNKGIDSLSQLADFQDDHVLVISLGVENVEVQSLYPWLVQLGYIDDPDVITKAYAAADIHISFSKTETLGQSFLEAAACHTPSIGYRATGITDSITDGVTGCLVDLNDSIVGALNILRQDNTYRGALSTWAGIHAENTRSLYAEYHSFYRALFESKLVPMNILGRKIGFAANLGIFPELANPLKDVEMAPYLGSGWSTISPKGILSTGKKAYFNFTLLQPLQTLKLEVSAHWSVSSSLVKRLMALAFYGFIRGDSANIYSRLKKIFIANKQPLEIDVLCNDHSIDRFTLKSTRKTWINIDMPKDILENNNILSFEINGAVVLSEIGVSSECREFGFRLHKLIIT